MRVDAHLMVGVGLAFTSDLEGGLKHLEDGIKCFESQRHGSHRFQLGANPGIACYTTAGARFVAARVSRSRARAREPRRHAGDRAAASVHDGVRAAPHRLPPPAAGRSRSRCATAQSACWTSRTSTSCRSGGQWEPCCSGRPGPTWATSTTASPRSHDGVAQYQGLRSPPVFWPLLLYVRARAFARAGQAGGWRSTSSTRRSRSPAGRSPPDLFFAMKGELLLRQPDVATAAETGSDGVSTRRPSWARDAAAARGGRAVPGAATEENRELLRAIHATFTEGFATPDLADATAVLDASAA